MKKLRNVEHRDYFSQGDPVDPEWVNIVRIHRFAKMNLWISSDSEGSPFRLVQGSRVRAPSHPSDRDEGRMPDDVRRLIYDVLGAFMHLDATSIILSRSVSGTWPFPFVEYACMKRSTSPLLAVKKKKPPFLPRRWKFSMPP